jgi:hypothetical protein
MVFLRDLLLYLSLEHELAVTRFLENWWLYIHTHPHLAQIHSRARKRKSFASITHTHVPGALPVPYLQIDDSVFSVMCMNIDSIIEQCIPTWVLPDNGWTWTARHMSLKE